MFGTIGSVVAALILKGAEEAGEQQRAAWGSLLDELTERVRRQFQEQGDQAGYAALARVQDPPVAERQLAALAAAVDRQSGQYQEFAAQLRRLIGLGGAAGIDVRTVAQVAWGSQVSQIQDVTGSTINVNIGKLRA